MNTPIPKVYKKYFILKINFTFQENKYPWLVRLYRNRTNGLEGDGFCGGTLVSKKHVITAAQCTYFWYGGFSLPLEEDEIIIKYGSTNLDSSNLKEVKVKTIHRHQNFEENRNVLDGYDIAILELEEELEYTTPACLATAADSIYFNGKTATVTGWGFTSEDATGFPNPLVAKEVNVQIHAASNCEYSKLVPSIICDWDSSGDGGKGPCFVSIKYCLHLKDQQNTRSEDAKIKYKILAVGNIDPVPICLF